jgi:hypothetical protein
MDPQKAPDAKTVQSDTEASRHLTDAHDLLTTLRKRVGQHPELDEAISKLEMALAVLTARTGGLL